MKNNKIHVYCMPGMAASSLIFEYITLPEDTFQIHFLDWFMPLQKESLSEYAKRMANNIKHENPVLLGVSFGGILIQEIAKHISTHKLIVISSIKNNRELPKKMILARYTKIHKLLPTGIVNNITVLSKYAFGSAIAKRLDRYEKYLFMSDKYYLDWSIDQIVNWNQHTTLSNTIHIHGDKDTVFPIRYIKNCIRIEDGTHVMIISKFRWFNENLPHIICC